MSGLRVIAGSLGGRMLRAPPGRTTRPTAGRAREALFSILGDVSGGKVLDLFAGSGALGIEALSRGATHAVFVESSRAAVNCIRHNLSDLALEARAKVLPVRVEAAKKLLPPEGRFELILCDPPWTEIERAVAELESWVVGECLAAGGRLVLEHSLNTASPTLPALSLHQRRNWGDTAVSIFSPAE